VDKGKRVQIHCDHCQKRAWIPEKYLGKKLRCSACKEVFRAVASSIRGSGPTQNEGPDDAFSFQPSGQDDFLEQGHGSYNKTLVEFASEQPGPGRTRCPDCHLYVLTDHYRQHIRTHDGTLPDGQNTLYSTLPPEERYQGSLTNIPTIYWHPGCDGQTVMPEDIIRSYLTNPWFYSQRSFCSGCRQHVSTRNLYWVNTKESLYDYNKRLQKNCPKKWEILGKRP